MPQPSKATMAKLNSLNYTLADGNKKEKKKATKKITKLGYEVASTSRGVSHFKSTKEDDKHNVVVVKGTNPLNKKDLISDFKLAIGKSGTDKQFKNRQKKVKAIYKSIDPDEERHITAHSLGASQVTRMLSKSKSIRDNTTSATNFNTGMTPAFNAEISKGLTSQDKKEIKSKLTHHHQKGDPISAALTIGPQLGKVKTQTKASASPHSLTNFHKDKSIPKSEHEPDAPDEQDAPSE